MQFDPGLEYKPNRGESSTNPTSVPTSTSGGSNLNNLSNAKDDPS